MNVHNRVTRYTYHVYRKRQNRSTFERLKGHASVIVTDAPLPDPAVHPHELVLDGGGRQVLRVLAVVDDEVVVEPVARRDTFPFEAAGEDA